MGAGPSDDDDTERWLMELMRARRCAGTSASRSGRSVRGPTSQEISYETFSAQKGHAPFASAAKITTVSLIMSS